jgi:hypothetical protein
MLEPGGIDQRSTSARRRCSRAVGLSLLATALSCSAGDGGPFVGSVSRSQYFELHSRVDEPLCPTLLSLLDQHAEQIGGKVGLRLDPANPFRYYKFRDAADFKSNAGGCAAEADGCALGRDVVYSTRSLHAHELAHVYIFRAWQGGSAGFVNEGEAVALSCDPGYGAQPSNRPGDVLGHPDWRDLLNLHGNSIAGYSAAGFWTTHLAARFGWDGVRELHRRIRPGISAEDFEREFARVYPTSMAATWSAALDTPGAPACDDEWGCTAIPLDVGARVPPDCDGQMHRSITVLDQLGVVLTLSGAGSQITLRSCNTPAAPIYDLISGGTERTTHIAALPAGTFTLFSAPAPTQVEFVSYLPAGFNAATCVAAPAVSLDATGTTYVDVLAGAVNGWIRIAGGGHIYNVSPYNLIWQGWPGATGAPAVCDSCDSAATCVALPAGQVSSIAIPDGAALRLTGVSAVASSSLYGQITFLPVTPVDAGP